MSPQIYYGMKDVTYKGVHTDAIYMKFKTRQSQSMIIDSPNMGSLWTRPSWGEDLRDPPFGILGTAPPQSGWWLHCLETYDFALNCKLYANFFKKEKNSQSLHF